MPSFRNYKICDNAPECSGIEVCPVNAITFDNEKNTIVIDNQKCISCGLCEKACPIGAFRVGKTEEECKKIEEDIVSDERTLKDLFVDRYGAVALSEFFSISKEILNNKIESGNLVLIEIYKPEEAECLLKSIPIKKITDNISQPLEFYKLEYAEELEKEYHINSFPCLFIFKDKKLLGKIEGYYNIEQFSEFEQKISKILN